MYFQWILCIYKIYWEDLFKNLKPIYLKLNNIFTQFNQVIHYLFNLFVPGEDIFHIEIVSGNINCQGRYRYCTFINYYNCISNLQLKKKMINQRIFFKVQVNCGLTI